MKIAAIYTAISALFMFFCWWAGVDFLQRDFMSAFMAFSSLLLAGPVTGLILTFPKV